MDATDRAPAPPCHLASPPPNPACRPAPRARPPPSLTQVDWDRFDLVVIGASTGGPPAIQTLVDALPADFPVAVLVVQHMPVGFTAPFAERLHQRGRVSVVEAAGSHQLDPGTVAIARAGLPLRVTERLTLARDADQHHRLHVPSIDRLMATAAEARPGRVMGILLTGMGQDGASGMLALHAQGSLTIAESEATSAIYGMPRVAHERGAVSHLLPLYDIARLFT